ncbi:DUF2273 domain-containing protein [Cryobacterium flavum]|uniref:DUF2273 domain-containing protein n=2 Tax=Cryobacterium flavum TaxID=1424659 RepID=A0ABY2HZ37_9MICO|nr:MULTISPECIES: DUF2273 domain-containing protein [Cryobacterium]TFB72004.1 DUF2273 domain-containing protein [Cryobacterium flavum]
MTSATRTGMLVGAVLALTWVILGFWVFLFVGLAILVGALLGRVVDGRLDVSSLIGAFQGKRSSS